MSENNFTHRFPQYLSKPIQVLWFETDELIICRVHPHPGPALRQNHVDRLSDHPIFLYPDQASETQRVSQAYPLHARFYKNEELSRIFSTGVSRMNTNIFLQKTSNLFVENRLLKFIIVIIGPGRLLQFIHGVPGGQISASCLNPTHNDRNGGVYPGQTH